MVACGQVWQNWQRQQIAPLLEAAAAENARFSILSHDFENNSFRVVLINHLSHRSRVRGWSVWFFGDSVFSVEGGRDYGAGPLVADRID